MATLAQVFTDIARNCGTIKARGVATATSTTTMTDANNERAAITDTSVPGCWVTFTGTDVLATGLSRKISSYGTIGVYTWIGPSLTFTGSVPTWVRTAINPQDMLDAITTVVRKNRRRQALTYRSTALVTGNLLDWYGDFEEWNSALTAPTGWTAKLSATATQLTSASPFPPPHGDYAIEMTDVGGSGAGNFTYMVPPSRYGALAGQALTLHGYARVSSGSLARVEVRALDANGNLTVHDYDSISANWTRIEDMDATKFTLPSTISNLQVRLYAGPGGVADFDDIVLYSSVPQLIQRLPALMAGLPQQLQTDDGYPSDTPTQGNQYWHPLDHGRHWTVFRDTTDGFSYIRWNTRQEPGRHVLIEGWQYPTITGASAFTATVDCDPDWLALAAAAEVLEGQIDAIRYPALAGTPTLLSRVQARLTDKANGNGEDDRRSMEHGIIWLDNF